MHDFKIALPQLCLNVICTIMCFLTLAEEDGFMLSLPDLLQLYTVKKEKDEQWRKSYFFFPVNELTYGKKTDLFGSEWTARADR
ncbi:hypothetical protein AtEden1_Chr3g0194421 [Arabidopsis thaliana]